jgi:hypothetical protein
MYPTLNVRQWPLLAGIKKIADADILIKSYTCPCVRYIDIFQFPPHKKNGYVMFNYEVEEKNSGSELLK